MIDTFEKMDRMYRYQRHIYDLTRKYYLLGRDRLLNEMDIKQGDKVLEVGCGTGRNLKILASHYPQAHFYGLDASAAMLENARSKLERAKLPNVRLERALAEEFDLGVSFDTVFFSYSISMIPSWKASINRAVASLNPAGRIYIVDFYDQAALPGTFQRALRWWLEQFHVRFPDELIPFMKDLENGGVGKLKIISLFRRYSFIAELRRGDRILPAELNTEK